MKHKCTEALHRSTLWDRGQSGQQELSRWGWRLSNSWGKPGRRCMNRAEASKGTDKGSQEPSLEDQIRTDGEKMLKKLDAMRREFEKDPYTALFGTRMQKNVFNPKSISWALRDVSRGTRPPQPRDTEVSQMKDTPSTAGRDHSTTASAPTPEPNLFSLHGRSNDGSQLSFATETPAGQTDYQIDPITLHKVWPKKYQHGQDPKDVTTINIPVKTFTADANKRDPLDSQKIAEYVQPSRDQEIRSKAVENSKSSTGQPKQTSSFQEYSPHSTPYDKLSTGSPTRLAAQPPQDWLVAEGFGPRLGPRNIETMKQHAGKDLEGPCKTSVRTIPESPAPVQSLRHSPSSQPENILDSRQLHYDAQEPKVEDLDLLRSSDVRAASGILKRPRQETTLERQCRRESLRNDFERDEPVRLEKNTGWDIKLNARKQSRTILTILNDVKIVEPTVAKNESTPESLSPIARVEEHSHSESRIQPEELLHAATLGAQEVAPQHAKHVTEHFELGKRPGALHAAELGGESDTAFNIIGSTTRAQWYKDKAPHTKPSTIPVKTQNDVMGNQIEQGPERHCNTSLSEIKPCVFETAPLVQGAEHARNTALKEDEEKRGATTYTFDSSSDTLEANLVKESKKQAHGNDLGVNTSLKSNGSAERLVNDLEKQRVHHGTLSETIWPSESKSTDWIELGSKEIRPSPFLAVRVRESQMRLVWVRQELRKIKNGRVKSVTSQPAPAAIYRILAYDSNTGKMTTADTSSSFGRKEEVLSPSTVLLRLKRPTEFFPYITSMQADGFEIISGRDDMLVFQKMRYANDAAALSSRGELGQGVCQSQPVPRWPRGENKISNNPTCSHFSTNKTVTSTPLPCQSRPGSKAPTGAFNKITREDVFSDSTRRLQDIASDMSYGNGSRKSRFREITRRVLWVGVWTAGCAYAVGVVAEYFRTGGASGLGPQGF